MYKILIIILFLTTCDSLVNENSITNDTLITPNINNSPLLFYLNESTYQEPWDIKLSYDSTQIGWDQWYRVDFNSSAGVMGVRLESNNFEESTLPDTGMTYNNDIMGSDWWDLTTYSGASSIDHSVQGKDYIYFLWTSSYNFIKIQILEARVIWCSEIINNICMEGEGAYCQGCTKKYQITIKYQSLNDNFSKELNLLYAKEEPLYFNFNLEKSVEITNWDLAFSMVPVFSEDLNSYQNMPTVLLNMLSNIKVAIIDDLDFNSDINMEELVFYNDTAEDRNLGYEGAYQVIHYHPEPPYNHKAIVEYPNRLYIIETLSSIYKFSFDEYNHGYISFNFQKLY